MLDLNAVCRAPSPVVRRSLELERLTAEGISRIERRGTFEVMHDLTAELFELHTGSARAPRAGRHAGDQPNQLV